MRNTPYIKYLLFGLVAVIWGLIIFRILHAMNSGESTPIPISHKSAIKLDDDTTYNLISVVYPDPFFKNLQSEEVKVAEEKNLSAKVPDSIDTEIAVVREDDDSPSIKYSGYIYNPITKRKTAIISIDGYTKSVGLNESIGDKIKITFISNQKIGIVYKGRMIEYFMGG